jgi:predicted metalloenzyme YecM
MKLPGIDLEMDHVCFRCSTRDEYLDVKRRLAPFGTPLEEGMIGGRPILIFLLEEPIVFRGWRISCLEIPCPKPGRSHSHGLEHVEFVICPQEPQEEGQEESKSFMHSRPLLEAFMSKYPGKYRNCKY